MALISSSKVVITGSTQASGSTSFSSTIGLTGSLAIHHDGNSNDDGFIQFTEVAASADPVANKGKIYCKEDSGTKLIFRQGSTESDLLPGAGGSARWTIHERFYFAALLEDYAHFTNDVDSGFNQYKFTQSQKVASAVTGSVIEVPVKYFGGYLAGPFFHAGRDCTVTNIGVTGKIKASTGMHTLRIRLWAGTCDVGADATITNDSGNISDTYAIVTAVGSADLTNDGSTEIVDFNVFSVNESISSSNSVSAGEFVLMSVIPIGGASAANSYISVTVEFTEA